MGFSLTWVLYLLVVTVISSFGEPCNFSDLKGLRGFKSLIHVDTSGRLSNWVGRRCCTWEGVFCSNVTGRVTEIRLPGFISGDDDVFQSEMEGELSPEICLIGFLEVLDLGGLAGLRGEIPGLIGFRLKRLRILYLYGNKLSGGLPESMGKLPELQELAVHENRLSGEIPASLGDLRNLNKLVLYSNGFSGEVPDSITNLTNLVNLDLHGNSFSGHIPDGIGELRALRELDFSSNFFSGEIPASVNNLTAVSVMYLDNNFLAGKIPFPASSGELTSLGFLRLNDNQLAGAIPDGFGLLGSLRRVSLSDNRLVGPIPASLGNLTALAELYLAVNNFSSQIPKSIGLLSNLILLNLSHNQIQEPLPQELGSLQNLQTLDLSFNDINLSAIPTWITILRSLSRIHLAKCGIRGRFPNFSGKESSSILELDLSMNYLTGSIPHWLGSFTRLYLLNLSRNSLESTIPGSIVNLENLGVLDLRENKLTGSVSLVFEIRDLFPGGSLTHVDLSGNMFSGDIDVIGEGSQLGIRYLDLSRNYLLGRVPDTVGKLKQMRTLDLSYNELGFELPEAIAELDTLEMLKLQENRFTGRIPTSFLNLRRLEELDLSGNLLVGKIPDGKPMSDFPVSSYAGNKGEIQCEQPNNSLYTFTGNLIVQEQTLSLNPNHLLLRGCSLRNTEYIVGAVVFTGHETKVMMNTMNVPSKRSTLERKLDKLILTLFATLSVMCLIGSISCAVFLNHKYYYMAPGRGYRNLWLDGQFNPDERIWVFVLTLFTLLTLYSPIIPISLYVSIEMIKFIQSTQFINKDLHMYHVETNTPALARTSNLNEELGQVEYIFSDKTGTLTRNLMEFFKCSIGGEVYGTGITEIERGIAQRSGLQIEEPQPSANMIREKGFNFDDARLMRGAWRNEPNPEACKEFFRCLAICHTVLPEGDESPEKIKYQAASPDEAALVSAAKNFGFFFFRRTPTTIYVRESHVESVGKFQDVTYEILNVLEFNSTRKRQSVVCRYSDGRLVLYCKGADSVIFERLAAGNDGLKRVSREHLEQFGSSGLRTLCLAYKDLNPATYESWNEKFIQAKSSLVDREKKLDEMAELIENDLILIGCTAIEDKLQEGVPECIETLSRAGIKIWMLTGDKIETAINIAYACNLINNEMKQFVISSETDAIRQVEERGDQVEIARFIKEEVKKELMKCKDEAQNYFQTASGPKLALIIDGKCLMYALDPSLRVMLLNLSLNCSSVVCCRVSPLQKAQVTSLVKKGAQRITLSIGDGANDVSMIQAAHVGVGISGMEGMQAVMASDFAIAQFRFLTDLLLVHGRWSYARISKVVTYFFYKNLTFTLTQFWFTFQAGFSGQRFYDDWYQSLYNVIFTALPVVIVGLFDKDVSASLSKKYPQLYMEGIRNTFFSWRVVAVWAFFSVYQSLVLYHFTVDSSNVGLNSSGKMFGLWDVSTVGFTCVVVTVNIRLLMICNSITRWHYIGVGGSIVTWFIFAFIYSSIQSPGTQTNVLYAIFVVMSTFYFYLALLLVPVAALLCDFIYLGIQRWFFPYDYQVIQEIHRHEPDDNSRTELLKIRNQLTPDEARSHAISQLPRQISRHTGFAFDSPGYESFFAAQFGIHAPQKAWDVVRRASVRRSGPKPAKKK